MSTGGSLRLDHSNSDNSTKNSGTSKSKRSEKESSHVDDQVPHYLLSLPNPEVEESNVRFEFEELKKKSRLERNIRLFCRPEPPPVVAHTTNSLQNSRPLPMWKQYEELVKRKQVEEDMRLLGYEYHLGEWEKTPPRGDPDSRIGKKHHNESSGSHYETTSENEIQTPLKKSKSTKKSHTIISNRGNRLVPKPNPNNYSGTTSTKRKTPTRPTKELGSSAKTYRTSKSNRINLGYSKDSPIEIADLDDTNVPTGKPRSSGTVGQGLLSLDENVGLTYKILRKGPLAKISDVKSAKPSYKVCPSGIINPVFTNYRFPIPQEQVDQMPLH